MNRRLKYLFVFILITIALAAQKPDSNDFKLKPFFVGFEVGRSPYRLNKAAGDAPDQVIKSRFLPYLNFMLGNNLKLNQSNYLVLKIGYAIEYSKYSSSSTNIESFNGVNTIGTQTVSFLGFKKSYYNSLYTKNTSFIGLSIDYLHLSDIFANDKIMLYSGGGLSLNYEAFSYSKSSESFTKDSIGITIQSYNYTNLSKNSFSKNRFDNLCYQFNIGIGIIYNTAKLQHQIGLKLYTRLNNPDIYYLYIKRSLFRISYNINF